jgi:hypothetical protein
MVNQDGQTTWFRLVEVGERDDVLRLAQEPHTPTVIVDIALPVLPAFDGTASENARPAKSRLIQLNVRTVTGDDATGLAVWRDAREKLARDSGVGVLSPTRAAGGGHPHNLMRAEKQQATKRRAKRLSAKMIAD